MTIAQEKTAAGRIIDRALARGFLISVNDGEEWTVRKSNKRSEIMGALQTTDEDYVSIRTGSGERIGTIYFVWGNSPDEIVCDYTDNETIGQLVGE